MKLSTKLCLAGMVAGTVGSVVFGTIMIKQGLKDNIGDIFSYKIGEGIIGIDFGSSKENVTGYDEPYIIEDKITKLDFEIGGADIYIKPGSCYSVKTDRSCIMENYVSDGVWYIETASDSKKGKCTVTVTVPETEAVDMNIEVGAGGLYAENILANNLSFSIGAGTGKAEQIDVAGALRLEIGAGSFEGSFLSADDVNIECGMGSTSLSFDDSQSSYRITASCGLGRITAGDITINGTGEKTAAGANSSGRMNLECGMGSIDVSFK